MKKLFKLLLPLLFLAGYALSSYFVYYGINEDVFSVKDSFQQITGNLLLIAILLMYARFVCPNQWKKLSKNRLDLKKALIILLTIPGFQLLTYRIILVYNKSFHYTCMPTIKNSGELKLFLFDAFFAVFIAPLLEELLFRLCIISSYNSLTGKLYGMITGALLFGYAHSTLPNRISSILLGFVLGMIFLITDNLSICILIHAGINLFITIYGYISSCIQDESIISFTSSLIYVNTPILLISIFISLICGALLFKNRWQR